MMEREYGMGNCKKMESRDKDLRRGLVIVDPQVDFITGSLKVPGAVEAMDALAGYLKKDGESYHHIFITCDFHPLSHISFKDQGGEWPLHCVQASVGAAIWPVLMDQLIPLHQKVSIHYKGEDPNRDEYSIFQAEKEAAIIDSIIRKEELTHLDLCGLAGDVCVQTTLKDALRLFPDIRFRILEDFTASLDGGECIQALTQSLSSV